MNDKERVLELLKGKEQIINQFVPNYLKDLKDTENKLKNNEINVVDAINSYTSLCLRIAHRWDGER